MAEVRVIVPKAIRIAGNVLSFVLDYLLAGGALVGGVVLFVVV